MQTLIIVNNPKDWPIRIPDVTVVSSKRYLTDPAHYQSPRSKIFNLCRSYRYQTKGYYVSLLAGARGHRVFPSVSTLQDLRSSSISRAVTEDLDDLINASLRTVAPREFTLSIYFGRNLAKKYDRLALRLFNMFQCPLLRAHFVKEKEWRLKRVFPLPASEIPENHREFVIEQANRYFRRPHRDEQKKRAYYYDVAILHDPGEPTPPSDEAAMKRFLRAAERVGLNPELITKDDFGRLGEFDALFIRATTAVNGYTYQFARRAEAEGLAVLDEPESIIRCTNKVYLTEALTKAGVAVPRTWTIHDDNLAEVKENITYPCILKVPDSSFSQGVVKASSPAEFQKAADAFLEKSDLIVAQEFLPTDFDWRIGVLDGKALYACKYFMARRHWQILKKSGTGRFSSGRVKAVPLSRVPPRVLRTAMKAANAMGRSLYGVDLKDVAGRAIVIEVNDNPTIEAGYEDRLVRNKLYIAVMRSLLTRIRARRRRGAP